MPQIQTFVTSDSFFLFSPWLLKSLLFLKPIHWYFMLDSWRWSVVAENLPVRMAEYDYIFHKLKVTWGTRRVHWKHSNKASHLSPSLVLFFWTDTECESELRPIWSSGLDKKSKTWQAAIIKEEIGTPIKCHKVLNKIQLFLCYGDCWLFYKLRFQFFSVCVCHTGIPRVCWNWLTF